jgi:uncharacterized integral membrane protein
MATEEPGRPAGTPTRGGPDARQWTRYIVAAIVVIYVLCFMFLNTERVEVDYVFFSRGSRLIYVILISAVLGAVAVALVKRIRRRH